MSIFSDNITNSTDLQSFYNRLKTYIEDQFNQLYDCMNGDLMRVSSIFNREFNQIEVQKLFNEHEIYHPYFHCQLLVGKDYFGRISINIFYTDDPTIYVHDKAKIFLSLNLPLPKQL